MPHFVPDYTDQKQINLDHVATLVLDRVDGESHVYLCFAADGEQLGEVAWEDTRSTPPIVPNHAASVLINFYFVDPDALQEGGSGQMEVAFERYAIIAWRIVEATTAQPCAAPVVCELLEDDAVTCIEEHDASGARRWIFYSDTTCETWVDALKHARSRLTWREGAAARREVAEAKLAARAAAAATK